MQRLSESIIVSSSPSKRPCPNPDCSEPTLAPILVPTPSTTATKIIFELDEKLPFTEDIAHHKPKRPSAAPDHFSQESLGNMNSFSSHPKPDYIPSREEMVELIRQIHSFTERETLVQDMRVLFSTTQRIPVEIETDLDRSFTTRLWYSTPNATISCIMPMEDYTTFEMAEMVSRSLLIS